MTPGQYYDFRKHRHLVRAVLEDFKPWERYRAVTTFYELIEQVNGQGVLFETNDCAFKGIQPNADSTIAKNLQAFGRVMILFRYLPYNIMRERLDRLVTALSQEIARQDPEFELGCIWIELRLTRYMKIARRSAI